MLNNKIDILTFKHSLELTITLDKDLGIKDIIQRKVTWYDDEVLDKIFKVFMFRDSIKLDEKYIFYLKRNDEIVKKLGKDQKLRELQLKNDDEIFVSYNELKTTDKEIKFEPNVISIKDNINSERLYGCKSSRRMRSIKNSKNNVPPKINKKILFYIGIILLFFILVLIILLLKFLKKKKNEENTPIETDLSINNAEIEKAIEYKKEELMIKKSYPLNLLLRFESRKSTEIEIEGENNTVQNLLEINDFIFIVRNNSKEKDEINLIEKEVYIGYIGLLNHTTINETDEIVTIYDKKLNEYINDKNNLNNEKIDDLIKNIGEEGNLCFAKIVFYLNGEIKNYYIPNGFQEPDFTFIEDITLLMIPKISPNLYDNNSLDDSTNEFGEKNKKRRLFNNKYKKYTIPYKQFISEKSKDIRRTEEKDNYTDLIIVEEYLVEPTTESLEYESRKANEIISNDSITQNTSILSHHSLKTIESDEIKMEDSYTNTSIYSYVDNEGILEYVKKVSVSSMANPDNEEDELNNQIYDNQNEEELKQNNKINFNVSSIFIINSMLINRTYYSKNESLKEKLYAYFDKFTYNEYNNNNKNNNTNSSQNEVNNQRNLEEDEEYYGMKKTIYNKDLYSYNLLGLKMQKQIFSEINPKTGTTNSYYVMAFGNKNTKINVPDQQTNLHIILERKNQMAYKLLSLLKQSNLDLKLRNKKYIEVILDMEKNVSNFLKDYDYSEIFKDSLDNLYIQVSNFSGEFFYEFISLVNNVYINYTEILNNSMSNKYDFVNEIILITREEYINFIYNMIDVIEIFENNSLTFFQNLEEEISFLDNFHIDLLYDLIDIIYESKQIFKNFNKNLFKSIEKGLLNFNYDIKDFINEIMDDILYVIDFLAININKNEIIKKAIDYESRTEASQNLKGLKDIIMTIMDMIIVNINKDYESQMSLENKNGIKKYSFNKENEFITNTEEKSNILIGNIKSKINHIELYELYSDNLDSINNIINKTINEYIQYSYNNIIKKSINFKPEYLDEESDLNKNLRLLFNASNDIIFQINNEINDINEFIFNYTNTFIDENLYNIYYNLYNFRISFLDKEMKNLYNKFILLFKNLVDKKIMEIKGIIDNNYNLAKEVLDEQNEFFNEKSEVTSFCTGFAERYNIYKNKLNEFIYGIIYNSDFSSLFKKYFDKLRNDIINYVKKKINSNNKYYFNTNYYNQIFYFVEPINKEIVKLLDNINNYFSEINFVQEIHSKLIDLFDSSLTPYNNKTFEDLDNYYNSIYEKTGSPNIMECSEDITMKKRVCKTKFIWCWKHKNVQYYYNCTHQENFNSIQTYIEYSEDELSKETNNIINNFINKNDKYLSKIFLDLQNFYSNLYVSIENKIKYSNVNKFVDNYLNIFNNFVNTNYNEKILEGIFNQNNNIRDNFNDNLIEIEKNIKLLNETYYKSYYLSSYDKFIEYPEEIIYKINQFQKELIFNSENIIKNLKNIFKNRINNIIKSTKIYILNFVNQDYKYILSSLNRTYAIPKYLQSKENEINSLFRNINNKIESIDKNFNIENENNSGEKNLFVNINNYNKSINKILNDSQNFVNYLEGLINNSFIVPSENCTEIINNNTIENYSYINEKNQISNNTNEEINNIKICPKEKKQIGQNYSKYNYNVIKLRTGIYYTKTLFENLDILFDDLNIETIINISNINYYDYLLNDKNIIYFFNQTKYKINQLKEKSDILIEEPFQNLMEFLNSIYLYENDYSYFIQKFQEIISFKNNDYNTKIIYNNEDTINNVSLLLNEFNKTLFKQIDLRNNYGNYNINEEKFKQIYMTYYSAIDNIFKEYKNKINSLNGDFKFHSIIRTVFHKFLDKKKVYFKDIINQYSKNFDLYLLNDFYDIGQYQSDYIQNEFNYYEFSQNYEYVEIYENNTSSYSKKIAKDILKLESQIKEQFKNIYDNFYTNFTKNISKFVNINFVEELKNNYSLCTNYSHVLLNINDNNKKDNISNDIIASINLVFENCSNFEINNTHIDIKEKIDYIIKNKKCIDIFYKIENFTYINETLQFLNCYKNNFYNSTAFYFDDFDKGYKIEIDRIINEILIKIKNNFIDENFLTSFLLENFELKPYQEIEENEIKEYIEDLEMMISYSNSINNDNIINYISKLLIDSFNASYFNLLDNFIINELIDNITILINNKFEIYIDYILQKVLNEFNYYLIILNNSEEIGESSKDSFINLYKDFINKVNETLVYLINDEIYYYLDIFYRKNKYIFKNNFVNYYINGINQYNIKIDKFFNFIEEIIIDKTFNKKLESISNDLFVNILINKIKKEINKLLNQKSILLFNEINKIQINMQQILNDIKTKELPENMFIINNLKINFTKLVNEQNNQYSLKIGNKTFELLLDFIHNDLEPPLLLIKNEYNQIEENLLGEILKIIDTFPNYYLIVKNELNLETIINNIYSFYDEINKIFINYSDDLYKDLSSYNYKLIYYTFINGLSCDKECDPTCLMNLNKKNNENNKQRRLSPQINKLKNKMKNERNISSNQQKRNLDGYNSKMGAITENDIYGFISEIKDSLFNFNNSYLNNDYKKMKNSLNSFLIKSSNVYLVKLKQNINIVASQFSTILTKNIYNQLENKLFKQYYEIESYIKNYSKLLEININKFSSLLDYSSKLIENNYYILYEKVNGYFQLFSDLIQEKLKYIDNNGLKSNNHRILIEDNFLEAKRRSFDKTNRMDGYYDYRYNSSTADWNKTYYDKLENDEGYHSGGIGNENQTNLDDNNQLDNDGSNGNLAHNEEYKYLYKETESTEIEIEEEEFEYNLDFDYDTSTNIIPSCIELRNIKLSFLDFGSIKIMPGLDLGFIIEPLINGRVCIGIGPFKNNKNKNDNSFYIDIFGESELAINFAFGLYIPSMYSPVSLSINFGIKGILGSGKIGMRLNIYFTGENKKMFSQSSYYQTKSYEFHFYINLMFEINLLFVRFTLRIPIYDKILYTLYSYYYGKTRYYLYDKNKEIKDLCVEEINTIKFSVETRTINKCYK